MKILGLTAAAAAILATATLAAPAAQAGPFFHHHHGHWGGHHGYYGGMALVGAGLGLAASDECYTVRRRVFVPGVGLVSRRTLVCG